MSASFDNKLIKLLRTDFRFVDDEGEPIHVLWGIPKQMTSPAILITAYRPDPDYWTEDFMRRKT